MRGGGAVGGGRVPGSVGAVAVRGREGGRAVGGVFQIVVVSVGVGWESDENEWEIVITL